MVHLPHHMTTHVVLPAPGELVRNVGVQLGESVIGPLVVFYVVLLAAGLHGALLAAVGWALAAITVRLLTGGRPSMMLLLATAMALLRVGITALSSSAVVYFLQPTLATYLFGLALLVTVPLDRPLIRRLADDFCPLPPTVARSRHLRRFFQRLSLLWAGVLVVNASVTLVLLLTAPVTSSVPIASFASIPLFVLGLALSWLFFRRSIRAGGFVLRWGSPGGQPETAAAAE